MTGILLPLTSYLSPLFAQDDDKNMMFNPVEHAVVSQTIAPDARAAGIGILPNIRSVSVAQVSP